MGYLGVHLTDGNAKGRRFVERHGWTFPVISDTDWEQAGRWGIRGHPAIVLLDAEGGIAGGFYGGGDDAGWDELLSLL